MRVRAIRYAICLPSRKSCGFESRNSLRTTLAFGSQMRYAIDMKKCSECLETLSLEAFNKNKAKKDGLGSVCRSCMKVLRKAHYESNKSKVFDAVKERRQGLRDKIWAYKLSHPCVDCGESNPIVLDFDHLESLGQKEFNVSAAIDRGLSWTRIMAEIEKCEVVCANHHRIRTHTRGGWVRNVIIPVCSIGD